MVRACGWNKLAWNLCVIVGLGCGLGLGRDSATADDTPRTNVQLARVDGQKDWPQWRGPGRDAVSIEKGLLKDWNNAPPRLMWKATGLGNGFSSIAIAEGKIFTMGKRNGSESIIALDLNAQGKELWSARVGNEWRDGPRSTPTYDDGMVYAVGPHGDLVAVDAQTGKEVWRKHFGDDFGGRMMSGWGFCESPLIDGDRLLCTPGAKTAMIVALNKKTGAPIWKAAIPELGEEGRDGAGYSSIVISHGAGVKQYVQLVGRGCIGVSESGQFLWGYNRIANKTANIPTPIVEGDYVITSSGYKDGGTALLKLVKAGSTVKAEEVWYLPSKELQNHHGGMIRLGDYLYLGHGHNNGFPTCVEWKTGKVVWGRERGAGTGSAAVVFADGELYFRYENGVMALVEATTAGYKLNGKFDIPREGARQSWAHPVVHDKKLFLREQDFLYVYDIAGK